nr:MAG TPA: hypothetical protein [Bacteriophage sp.]
MHPCLPYFLVVGILYFHTSTDYIFTLDFTLGVTHFHTLVCTSLKRNSR